MIELFDAAFLHTRAAGIDCWRATVEEKSFQLCARCKDDPLLDILEKSSCEKRFPVVLKNNLCNKDYISDMLKITLIFSP